MKLGRYEVVRELGKGAMGIVYLAKDPLIGRLVALKTIRPAATSDDDETKEFQQRFIREAQAAGILSHPSIVTVHDIGQDPDTGISFISMEFVEGFNLKEVLTGPKPLTHQEYAEIIAQVAEALDFAHLKGIVHRDVKPANIIICGESRAKITDFGIAKIASSLANLTTTGQFLGTPNYMAPEQIRGTPVDGRSDIFSLGIVFYECLTKRKPFSGDSLTAISYKIVHEPFPPVREVNPDIPEAIEAIVAKCLAKDPAARYQRAREIATDLRLALTDAARPVVAEKMLVDETVIAGGSARFGTIEIPVPATSTPTPDPAESSAATPAAEALLIAPGVAPPSAAGGKFRQRAVPAPHAGTGAAGGSSLWKRDIPRGFAFALCAILILLVAWKCISIKRQNVPLRPLDSNWAEAAGSRTELIEKQRRIRIRANGLASRFQFVEAREEFRALSQLAPASPYVQKTLGSLDSYLARQASVKQRVELSREKYRQGVELFEKKQYAQAIPLFRESFDLDSNFKEASDGLMQSQLLLEEAQRKKPGLALGSPLSSVVKPPLKGRSLSELKSEAKAGEPATLTIDCQSPIDDGTLSVSIGKQVVLSERLFEERRFRRKTPRRILAERKVKAGESLEIYVVVSSSKVTASTVITRKFEAGMPYRLTLRINVMTKKIEWDISG